MKTKRLPIRNLWLALAILLIGQNLAARQITVRGTVRDTARQPLPGVTVLVKHASTGTVTGADGKIRIVVRKGAVKMPKAVYETSVEVVRPSKLAYRRDRDERRFKESARPSQWHGRDDDMTGGTFADFLRQSQERQKRQDSRRRK